MSWSIDSPNSLKVFKHVSYFKTNSTFLYILYKTQTVCFIAPRHLWGLKLWWGTLTAGENSVFLAHCQWEPYHYIMLSGQSFLMVNSWKPAFMRLWLLRWHMTPFPSSYIRISCRLSREVHIMLSNIYILWLIVEQDSPIWRGPLASRWYSDLPVSKAYPLSIMQIFFLYLCCYWRSMEIFKFSVCCHV